MPTSLRGFTPASARARGQVARATSRALPALVAAATLALTAVACSDSAGVSPPPPPPPADSSGLLIVDGLGAVSSRYTAEVAVRGTTAYTSTWGRRGAMLGNAIYVWDVSGATPQLVDSALVEDAATLGDVQLSDDGALLMVATEFAPGRIVLYSLADPRHPQRVSFFGSSNTTAGVHTAKFARVNGTLYAFLSIDPSPARLVIVDLSDPANPREVFAQAMGRPYVHDVYVRDGILFTALWHDGLGIWDIGGGGKGGTPAAPVRLGTALTVNGYVHNVAWVHLPDGTRRYAFVGEEGPGSVTGASSTGDIHVVDVSDFAHPREVAFYSVLGAGTHNFAVDESAGVLYAAYYNAGIRALDIRGDLSACTNTQRSADGRCDLAQMERELAAGLVDVQRAVFVWGVALADGSLYASDMFSGLWKLQPISR